MNEKNARLFRYMPHALGLGALGALGYGTYQMMKPKSFWGQAGDVLSGLGSSIGDISSDLVSFAKANPYALGAMSRSMLMPSQAIPPMTPPTGIPQHPIAQSPGDKDIVPETINSSATDKAPSTMNQFDLMNMHSMQDQTVNFSPYGMY